MVKPSVIWPDFNISALLELVPTGLSASQIANQLNKQLGTVYSRCAVIGKTRRLGLSTRGLAVLKEKRPDRPKRMRKTPQPSLAARALGRNDCRNKPLPKEMIIPDLVPKHLTLIEVSEADGCRWPYGDGPFTFCGHPRMRPQGVDSQSNPYFYCLTHFSMSVGNGTYSERAAHWGIKIDDY